MIATPVTVTDLAGQEDDFTLDKCGFQLVSHEIKSKSLQLGGYYGPTGDDDEKIKADYYPEMEQMIKDV